MNTSASPGISTKLRGYLPVLDGYRGIAILFVFLYHCAEVVRVEPSGFLNPFYTKMMLHGWCGVNAFFVLSGFLITGILLDTIKRRHFFTNFYLRRAIRIFPAYYIALLLIFFVLHPVLSDYLSYEHINKNQIWYWLFIENWLYVFQGRIDSELLAHFWSLANEIQFYLVWPVVIYFSPKRLLIWLCGVFIVCAVGIRAWLLLTNPLTYSLIQVVYVNPLGRMDAFAIGALINLWMRSEYALPRLLWVSKLVLIVSGVCVGVIFFAIPEYLSQFSPFAKYIGGFPLVNIFFGALLVLSVAQSSESLLGRVLTWSPLKWLGTLSYGVYVYHAPIVEIFGKMLARYSIEPYILNHLVVALLSGGVSLVISLFSWFCLEQPILKLKTYFPSNREENASSMLTNAKSDA